MVRPSTAGRHSRGKEGAGDPAMALWRRRRIRRWGALSRFGRMTVTGLMARGGWWGGATGLASVALEVPVGPKTSENCTHPIRGVQ